MVLFKRKPVQYLSDPAIDDEDAQVWMIRQTGEMFTSYESYIARIEFYKQRKFICEITGHSALSFFDAHASEMNNSKDVDKAFPEALREPVLRKVQFSVISRIDNLVDHIYEEFKSDFYPGEHVTVTLVNGERLNGVVREKAKFPEIRDRDGSIYRAAFSRYFVVLSTRPGEEALVDEDHICRDRKSFTKQILRSFIKNTVTREPWNGAPWLVKRPEAEKYRIDTEVPSHLLHSNKIAEKKATLSQKKFVTNGAPVDGIGSIQRYPELKPATKSHKRKLTQAEKQFIAQSKYTQYQVYQQSLPSSASLPIQSTTANEHQFIHFHSTFPNLAPLAAKNMPKPAPLPQVKYPVDDLEVPPSHDGVHRPSLKYLSQDTPTESAANSNGIFMSSVGALLETWDTLNVYCEIFKLDSFTFDDYIEALQVSSEGVECELFVEIHCAVLSLLVDEASKGGKINVSLPELPVEESSEEEDDTEMSAVPTPTPEPEIKTLGRRTRSSLLKEDVDQVKPSKSRSATAEIKVHRAAEMLEDEEWIERLRKRNFRNGGWEFIIVGLLHQLSLKPRDKQEYEAILANLAPTDKEPTQDTVRKQYASLDINLRVRILQILCLLTIETKAIRGYMEECSEEMTGFRKEKIDWQRARKQAMEELRQLDDERKILLPDNSPPSPGPVPETNGDTKMSGMEEDEGDDEDVESDDEEPHKGRSLRRGLDRAAERKRKREEEKEKKEKAEAAAKVPKVSNEFKRILKEIEKKKEKIKECEEEIAILDNDLREADCPRTRCLGKDRFWNRYYWFERNGMPYGGLPESSTADANYANGCLWVQGPDDIEREGFIDVSEEENRAYKKRFQMTIPERKRQEEGLTSVFTARQWGFYDEPDSLDMLIGWLDIRGVRELKLRKELQLQREKISTHMRHRKEYLAQFAEKNGGYEDIPATRVSTRTKTYVDTNVYRCLTWQNGTAVKELGHLHSEPPRARNSKLKKNAVADADRETRSTTNRQGKPLSRQGGRYTF